MWKGGGAKVRIGGEKRGGTDTLSNTKGEEAE